VEGVIGYRLNLAYGWRHIVVSRTYNLVIKTLFAGGWKDVDCAFKLLRRDVVEDLPLTSSGAMISTELLVRNEGILHRVTYNFDEQTMPITKEVTRCYQGWLAGNCPSRGFR